MTLRPTVAEISLKSLEQNFRLVQELVTGSSALCPMVKANAYGHGAVEVSRHLQNCGASRVGVSLVEEGLELRLAGITMDVLVFGGFDELSVAPLLEAGLTPVVSEWSHLIHLERCFRGPSLNVHVKFNTGMNRLGFDFDEVEKVYAFFIKNKKFRLEGLHTHLHTGENAADEKASSAKQAAKLLELAEVFKSHGPQLYLLNSAGLGSLASIPRTNSAHYLRNVGWGARPGIMLYGYRTDHHKIALQLAPVMTLKTRLQGVRQVKKGESVSYGETWTAQRNSLIGILPIGYADGVSRLLSNRGKVLIGNEVFPFAGRVCMDYIMVDLSHAQQMIPPRAEVIMFGGPSHVSLGADQLAEKIQTIPYEVLTSVSGRVPRRYLSQGGSLS